MSTREQFRDRMRDIWAAAVLESEYHYNTGGAIADAAMAVCTAAVRDVLADIEREFDPRLSSWLREWAAERGISLEGSGDE